MSNGADEQTHLLPNGDGTAEGGAAPKSTLHEIFLNYSYTPGMGSRNILVRVPAHVFNIAKITLISSYVNVLLVFVPLGIIAGVAGWNPTTVFVLNFFAIVPLAAVLSFATEEISAKLGQTMGGLLNATFGNAVELIVRFLSPSATISSSNSCLIG
jgi:Ca2+:H+ antiporter